MQNWILSPKRRRSPRSRNALQRFGYRDFAESVPPLSAFTLSSEPAAEPCLGERPTRYILQDEVCVFRRDSHASPTFFLPVSKALRRANCSRALSNSEWIFLSNTGRSGNTVQY